MLDLQAYLDRSREYLQETLLPFWMQRSPDPECGGFLTWFGVDGEPSGETTKTFLSQIRMLYVWSLAHRNGYGGGRCAELARDAADFLLEHYWDDEHGGWFWIADRAGKPTCLDKVGYGQCFGMYAFAEYFLATGDPRGREAMERSDAAVVRNMADTRHGGYLEIMNRDWQPPPGARSGGDRKSFDVHMHMMEALTSVYEVTGHSVHRHRLLEVIDLILHQSDQRRHDQRQARQQQGRQLIAERLAAPGGEHGRCRVAVEQMIDDGGLPGKKLVEAKVLLEGNESIVRH